MMMYLGKLWMPMAILLCQMLEVTALGPRYSNTTLQKGLSVCGWDHFCSETPPGNSEVVFVNGSCCSPCYCTEDCWLYGDCCPDAPEPSHENFRHFRTSCRKSNIPLNDNSPPDYVPGYRTVSECPVGYNNSTTRVKCEGSYDRWELDGGTTLQEYTLVSGPDGVVYRNRYCAICHAVSEINEWDVAAIECNPREYLQPSLYTDINNIITNCLIIAIPQRTIDVTRSTCSTSYTGTCPNSAADEELRRACEFSVFPVWYRHARKITVFNNVFCLLCNRESVPSPIKCDFHLKYVISSPFSSLIQLTFDTALTKKRVDHQSVCSGDSIYDEFTKTCKKVTCPITHTFKDGKCVGADIKWYRYGLDVYFGVNVFDENVFNDLVRQGEEERFAVIVDSVFGYLSLSLNCMKCQSYIFSSKTKLSFYIKSAVLLNDSCTYTFIKRALLKNMFAVKELSVMNEFVSTNLSFELFPTKPKMTDLKMLSLGLSRPNTDLSCFAIHIPRLFHCPYITLNKTEFCQWRFGSRSCNLTEDHDWVRSRFELVQNDDDDTVNVCTSDYFLTGCSGKAEISFALLFAYVGFMSILPWTT